VHHNNSISGLQEKMSLHIFNDDLDGFLAVPTIPAEPEDRPGKMIRSPPVFIDIKLYRLKVGRLTDCRLPQHHAAVPSADDP
jgi:hypothetical protein